MIDDAAVSPQQSLTRPASRTVSVEVEPESATTAPLVSIVAAVGSRQSFSAGGRKE
ncbi:hypothetical protein [Lentzea sp. NPDC004782]|uniref:hypothetical protein n=1 Tax=Lentzea sp. NPDC004782 TaxID=3154458 RepID=UPI0033BBC67E